MSDVYICGHYDLLAKRIDELMLVLPLQDDLRMSFRVGETIEVSGKFYTLTDRKLGRGNIIQYTMKSKIK